MWITSGWCPHKGTPESFTDLQTGRVTDHLVASRIFASWVECSGWLFQGTACMKWTIDLPAIRWPNTCFLQRGQWRHVCILHLMVIYSQVLVEAVGWCSRNGVWAGTGHKGYSSHFWLLSPRSVCDAFSLPVRYDRSHSYPWKNSVFR